MFWETIVLLEYLHVVLLIHGLYMSGVMSLYFSQKSNEGFM